MLEGKKIGFLGAGMMAEAIVRGLIESGVDRGRIRASDPDESRLKVFREELGVSASSDNRETAEFADILILAVKPFMVADVLTGIADVLTPEKLLVSIAAGVKTDAIQSRLQADVPVVRVMPNTPCLIGEGASALAPGKFAGPADMNLTCAVFDAVGMTVRVTEDKLDAVTGLSGSGPAYVYMLVEALADGGVRMGLPKAVALDLAAQTVAGAAKMVLETGEHPAELRDKVMTPGGTTIAGVAVLEQSGFRSAAIEAVTAATERSKEMGKS